MGYFGNGFVFQEPPSLERLAALPADLGVVTYKHNTKAVWLADIWTCTGRAHWYFSDEIAEDLAVAVAPVAERQLQAFAQVCAAVRTAEYTEVTYGESALRLASILSAGLKSPVFYFAGDDESTDMAAIAHDGRITDLSARFGAYRVLLDDGVFAVEPRFFEEDPDLGADDRVVATLRNIPNIRVTNPVVVRDSEALYGSAVAMWPTGAGDPTEMLGVGTWDPFDNVERDYQPVFERACAVTEQPQPAAREPSRSLDREFTSLRPARTLFQLGVYAFGALVIALIVFVAGAYLLEVLR